jgi:hypothetical protein
VRARARGREPPWAEGDLDRAPRDHSLARPRGAALRAERLLRAHASAATCGRPVAVTIVRAGALRRYGQELLGAFAWRGRSNDLSEQCCRLDRLLTPVR